jgi:hypothetical protein
MMIYHLLFVCNTKLDRGVAGVSPAFIKEVRNLGSFALHILLYMLTLLL